MASATGEEDRAQKRRRTGDGTTEGMRTSNTSIDSPELQEVRENLRQLEECRDTQTKQLREQGELLVRLQVDINGLQGTGARDEKSQVELSVEAVKQDPDEVDKLLVEEVEVVVQSKQDHLAAAGEVERLREKGTKELRNRLSGVERDRDAKQELVVRLQAEQHRLQAEVDGLQEYGPEQLRAQVGRLHDEVGRKDRRIEEQEVLHHEVQGQLRERNELVAQLQVEQQQLQVRVEYLQETGPEHLRARLTALERALQGKTRQLERVQQAVKEVNPDEAVDHLVTSPTATESSTPEPKTTLAELGVRVVLVKEIGPDGNRIHCETPTLPPHVKISVTAMLNEARNRLPEATWKKRITSPCKCVAIMVTTGSAHWMEGNVLKLACRRCYNRREACMAVEYDGTIAVLPLPPMLRSLEAVAGEDGFYIAGEEGFVKRKPVEGPWQVEKTKG